MNKQVKTKEAPLRHAFVNIWTHTTWNKLDLFCQKIS